MPDLSPSIPDYTLLRPVGRGAYGEVWPTHGERMPLACGFRRPAENFVPQII